jgi:hypothetical protein
MALRWLADDRAKFLFAACSHETSSHEHIDLSTFF